MLEKLYSFLEKLDRRRQLKLLSSHKNVMLKGRLKIGTNNSFILYPNLNKVIIGSDFDTRNSVHIIVDNNAILEIGNHVFMNNFCSVNCLEHVSIGDNTLFGENVKIYDHNHQYKRTENNLNVSPSEFTKAPVIIGKNCWLGSNVTVLKGVTIGDNCIIGAGCTVYNDIPANSTVVHQQDLKYL